MSEIQETPLADEAPSNEVAQPHEGRAASATLRRLGAAVIDATTVAIPTGAVALAVAERFEIVADVGGRPQFSEIDQARIDTIDQGFNRAVRLGDQVFTLSGGRWWLAVFALVAITLVVFVVIPGRRNGRTLGKQAMGLADGDKQSEDGPEIVPLDELLSEFGVSTTPIDLDGPAPTQAGGDSSESVGGGSVASEPTDTGLDLLRALAGTSAPEATGATAQDTAGSDPAMADDDPEIGRLEAYESGPTASPASNMAPAFADLILAESSLSESPLNATIAPRSEPTGTDEPTAREPEWSDTWRAWTYQDPESGRWFRHDTERERWVPIG